MRLLLLIVTGLFLAVVWAVPQSVMASADIPAEAQSKYDKAEALRAQGQFNASFPIYEELLEKYSDNFSVNYGYGLLLAQMKRFPEAANALKTALNIGKTQEQMPDPSIWNSIGWVSLMNGDLDQAIEYFTTAKQDSNIYSSLSDETRMKLHNNSGYALMLMDRYEESKEDFKKAEELGSEKAKQNIEKVDSLIETQKKQNPDIPGVFAVVVLSIRDKERTQEAADRLRTELGLQKTETIDVYLAKNGMYLLAVKSNCSYAKAQATLKKVREKVPDAFVSSTTNWEPVQELPAKAAF